MLPGPGQRLACSWLFPAITLMSTLTILIQPVIMVVCPFILPPRPPIRHWPISTIDDATGVLPGATFWPSVGIFGCRPRCQCDLVSCHRNLPSPPKVKSNFLLQIPSAAAAVVVPQRDNKGPETHPLIVPIASFSLLSAFISYNTADAGSLGIIYSACTGLLGTWGLWVVSDKFCCFRNTSLPT